MIGAATTEKRADCEISVGIIVLPLAHPIVHTGPAVTAAERCRRRGITRAIVDGNLLVGKIAQDLAVNNSQSMVSHSYQREQQHAVKSPSRFHCALF